MLQTNLDAKVIYIKILQWYIRMLTYNQKLFKKWDNIYKMENKQQMIIICL